MTATAAVDLHELEATFTALLALDHAPVAIAMLGAPPAGLRKFRGQVPSSCSFWSLAASAPAGKSAFYTVPGDHYNCPIGCHTHHVALPAERAHELPDTLGLMASLGYLDMKEVPGIPVWPRAPEAIAYARLGDAPLPPDVVLFTLRASAAMLLGEAAAAAGVAQSHAPMGRPTCMAIPATAALGATTSLGCIGNRVYTGVSDDHHYVALRGSDVFAVAAALLRIAAANDKLRAYHDERRTRLTGPE